MAADRAHQIREHLANILLAFQVLVRANGMRERHARVVQLGLRSAQKLAQLLLARHDAPRAGERPI